MYYWNDLTSVPNGFGPSVVTIGNFDGVHIGHQRVLQHLVAAAESHHAAAVVVSFEPHPAKVHRPDQAPELIMGLEDRIETLATTGIQALVMMHYTLELAANTPEEFVTKVFVDALDARAVVVGRDVRFGRDNSGDLDTMRELGAKLGFEVIVIDDFGASPTEPTEADGDRRCSSTWVREALEDGDVATAARILGRPHRMRGEVVHGAARGRELGYPTANLSPDSGGYIPADGIYAGWLLDEAGTRWPAAISVGSNPTFEGVSRHVEAHVIDRPQEEVSDFDLYGQIIIVEFTQRLRGMVAYTGPEALIAQMHLDVVRTREVLSTEQHHSR
ncbi:riboflavin kinase/FMN adenylyltransferase [Arthrobacter sp. CAN_A212]|uniref:bifunctional riboflavin kinase/FAD synthetase n=1 Tax=unclassified Arthrobacter TaxID=235627 RepID=UPI0018CB5AB0|nr:bifunctional riboflavin kinase/FAD synthetase [Arthrobacter sp. CAN_C5]MBP2217556.1 riboflavin kinase/FMN adenylyltransferase [Arthrobacter sp. CAN_C5]